MGTSGAFYTATDNGYIVLCLTSSTQANIHVVENNINIYNSVDFQTSNLTDRYAAVPIGKGQHFSVYYNGTKAYFHFVYASGA